MSTQKRAKVECVGTLQHVEYAELHILETGDGALSTQKLTLPHSSMRCSLLRMLEDGRVCLNIQKLQACTVIQFTATAAC